jgi:hypothetical protein
MKKIIGIAVVTALVATSAFAVDFAARVYMTGSLLTAKQTAKTGDDAWTISGPQLWDQEQQDADALVINFAGEKAGAHFQLWYAYDGNTYDGTADPDYVNGTGTQTAKSWTPLDYNEFVRARSIYVWFKPISQVKITAGDISTSTYVERLHWWKVAAGGCYTGAKNWDHRWSSYATVEGQGFSVDINPIDKLSINLSLDTDPLLTKEGVGVAGGNFTYKNVEGSDDDFTYLANGAFIKYQILDNVSAAVSFRNEGKGSDKLLGVGADFGNFGTPYYGFLNARLNFSGRNGSWASYSSDEGMNLRAVVLDNYFKYSVGALTLQECSPVTIRLNNWKTKTTDPSYMTFDVKVSYAMDGGFTPYIEIDNNDDYAPIVFDSTLSDNFGIDIQPGVTFSVGQCNLDVSAKFIYGSGADHFLTVAIPFGASVAF